MIKVKGYELPNRADEMTVKNYEKISELLEKKVFRKGVVEIGFDYESEVEKWIDILECAGLPKEVSELMPFDELVEVIKQWNGSEKVEYPMQKEFELNGRRYVAFEGEKWVLNVKEGKLIEKFARKNTHRYVAEMLAVIYKDDSLSNKEHYEEAHIKHKAKSFRNELTAEIAVPYLMEVAKKLLAKGQRELENAEIEA